MCLDTSTSSRGYTYAKRISFCEWGSAGGGGTVSAGRSEGGRPPGAGAAPPRAGLHRNERRGRGPHRAALERQLLVELLLLLHRVRHRLLEQLPPRLVLPDRRVRPLHHFSLRASAGGARAGRGEQGQAASPGGRHACQRIRGSARVRACPGAGALGTSRGGSPGPPRPGSSRGASPTAPRSRATPGPGGASAGRVDGAGAGGAGRWGVGCRG